MGRGNGRVVTNLEGNGALKNKKLPFCSFFLTKNKPNHPNTIGVMFHPKIRNPNQWSHGGQVTLGTNQLTFVVFFFFFFFLTHKTLMLWIEKYNINCKEVDGWYLVIVWSQLEGPNFLLDLIEGTKDDQWVYAKERQGSRKNSCPFGT